MASTALSSQSVIITTAMAVSGAFILLSLCQKLKNLPSFQQLPIYHNSSNNSSSLRSCLSSERLKGSNKNKKKRVKFAENVKEGSSKTRHAKKNNGQVIRDKKVTELRGMQPNRAALYHGILRDRLHRVESY